MQISLKEHPQEMKKQGEKRGVAKRTVDEIREDSRGAEWQEWNTDQTEGRRKQNWHFEQP